jgi:hypothetical protein
MNIHLLAAGASSRNPAGMRSERCLRPLDADPSTMTVHLINPSHLSFGVGVITPRWLFVLAGATPTSYGPPRITDETLEPFDVHTVQPGDVVGIGIHTGNALRGYEIGTLARERGATVIFGGIHATLYPGEAQSLGGAHAVVKGDGDVVWPLVLNDAVHGTIQPIYEAGRVDADRFVAARWELLPHGRYMWGSVQTVRGCPKHCSFCSVWRTDGQKPRQRRVDAVVDEIVELRRRGFRFIALADDNFYPVTLTDFAMAERQGNAARFEQLRALRAERFALMDRLAQLPSDMVFFTQITMEAAEDTAFLDAMRRANIKGALVGVEAVTPEGLKDVYKRFNEVGEALIARLRVFRDQSPHCDKGTNRRAGPSLARGDHDPRNALISAALRQHRCMRSRSCRRTHGSWSDFRRRRDTCRFRGPPCGGLAEDL